jgi:hypothetical protein
MSFKFKVQEYVINGWITVNVVASESKANRLIAQHSQDFPASQFRIFQG